MQNTDCSPRLLVLLSKESSSDSTPQHLQPPLCCTGSSLQHLQTGHNYIKSLFESGTCKLISERRHTHEERQHKTAGYVVNRACSDEHDQTTYRDRNDRVPCSPGGTILFICFFSVFFSCARLFTDAAIMTTGGMD